MEFRLIGVSYTMEFQLIGVSYTMEFRLIGVSYTAESTLKPMKFCHSSKKQQSFKKQMDGVFQS